MFKPVKACLYIIALLPVFLGGLSFPCSTRAARLTGTDFTQFYTRGQAIVVAKNWHPWWVYCSNPNLCVRPEWKQWAQGSKGQEIFSYGAPHTGGVYQFVNVNSASTSVTLKVKGIYRLNAGYDACGACEKYFSLRVSGGPLPSNTGASFSTNKNIDALCSDTITDATFDGISTSMTVSGNNFVVALWMKTSVFSDVFNDDGCKNISDHNQIWKIE